MSYLGHSFTTSDYYSLKANFMHFITFSYLMTLTSLDYMSDQHKMTEWTPLVWILSQHDQRLEGFSCLIVGQLAVTILWLTSCEQRKSPTSLMIRCFFNTLSAFCLSVSLALSPRELYNDHRWSGHSTFLRLTYTWIGLVSGLKYCKTWFLILAHHCIFLITYVAPWFVFNSPNYYCIIICTANFEVKKQTSI